ncbi:MAG: 50S ribosomal protein L10 [Alphaproteobacteria bacterium]|nr:50S ribosomal protein L10 [Alphaproteobacteria bacterium]
MPTPRKSAEIDEIERRLKDAEAVILADYRGLDVTQIGRLRSQLRPAKVELRVVKNTLTRIAANRAGITGLDSHLEGPTAIAFASDDIGAAARLLGDFARTSRILTIKGGLLGSRSLDAAQVGQLAGLEPKPVLQATLAGTIQGPLAGFVGLLNGALSTLAATLDARAAQLSKQSA